MRGLDHMKRALLRPNILESCLSSAMIPISQHRYPRNEVSMHTDSMKQNPSKHIFFGNVSLNRFSFLRSNSEFIGLAVRSSHTRLIFLNNHQPLCFYERENSFPSLKLLKVSMLEVSNGLRDYLYRWTESNKRQDESLWDFPAITFLGMDKKIGGLEFNSNIIDNTNTNQNFDSIENSKVNDGLFHYQSYSGVPCFAIDISNNQFLQDEIVKIIDDKTGHPVNNENLMNKADLLNLDTVNGPTTSTFIDHLMYLPNSEASVFSQSAMYIDWLTKNKYCSGCGSKNLIVNGGTQLKCSSHLPETPIDSKTCVVASSSRCNVAHPRTDVAVISSVTDTNGSKILLVNNKRYPVGNMYSCVAGFLEPSETIEACVTREIWEETNVVIENHNPGDIKILLSQPWPYPATLMIGCCGITNFNEKNEVIGLEHDNELNDAKWFDIDYIKEVIMENERIDNLLIEALKLGKKKDIELLRGEKANILKKEVVLPNKNTIALELIKRIVL